MSSIRHHIAILFDPCTLDARNEKIKLKKAPYQLEFSRNFLSLILESISEYIRIIFDLHPSFITFDILSCGDKIHSQTSITKSSYIKSIERFASINGILSSDETKFVEAIEQFLLELPSDFYNSHKYSSPFNSHQFPPITHIIFIARNQDNIKINKYLINQKLEQQIDFIHLCKTAKIRNHSIKKVYILKYDKGDEIIKNWTKHENDDNDVDIKNNDVDDKDDNDDDDDDDDDNDDDIEFYESITGINKLHTSLLNLICNIQFPSIIHQIDIVQVPFKDPTTSIKTQLSIPMVCCINNINHKHLYNTMYFTNYDTESVISNQYNDIIKLQWSKIPDSDKFDWADWLTQNLILITPSKLDDTSRLLMKFINKKKIATLRAHYKEDKKSAYFIKSNYSNKPRITHSIRLIGLQLYLMEVIYVKDIDGYNINNNNHHDLKQINNKFPYYEYCLQSHLLPNIAHSKLTHCLKSWITNKNIANKIIDIKPPFFNKNNKLNIMEINDDKNNDDNNNNDNNNEMKPNINNFCKKKQFISSVDIHRVTLALDREQNIKNQIGRNLTAKQISEIKNDNIQNCANPQNISLFDMFSQSNE